MSRKLPDYDEPVNIEADPEDTLRALLAVSREDEPESEDEDEGKPEDEDASEDESGS